MVRESVDFKPQGKIHVSERDFALGLHGRSWGENITERGWEPEVRDGRRLWLKRNLNASVNKGDPTHVFDEYLLRFPSAPIYGINRKPGYALEVDRINFHTLRLLKKRETQQIKRIYIYHNGLNQVDEFYLPYQLAYTLLEEGDALLIRPLPGHLSRYPLATPYCETPLSRYLADPGDLFRQWLRHMVETQWLLSILAPLRSYRVVPGLELLAEGNNHDPGRSNSDRLTAAIYDSWKKIYVSSAARMQPAGTQSCGAEITWDEMKAVVETIRHCVNWQEPPLNDYLDSGPSEPVGPSLHVIGYSLGGFAAQSVFFTWPFAVSSCTTICSGGALSDITLQKFAHADEWRSVLNALPYELADAMTRGRLCYEETTNTVVGMNADHYAYLYRVFRDVFINDGVNTYDAQVEEFKARMFFVVGGRDPIISTLKVLEAGPQEGMNLLHIADLSHLPVQPEDADGEWQRFWMPVMTDVVKQFARRSEQILQQTLKYNWWPPDYSTAPPGPPPAGTAPTGTQLGPSLKAKQAGATYPPNP